jgi:hypothetical protein
MDFTSKLEQVRELYDFDVEAEPPLILSPLQVSSPGTGGSWSYWQNGPFPIAFCFSSSQAFSCKAYHLSNNWQLGHEVILQISKQVLEMAGHQKKSNLKRHSMKRNLNFSKDIEDLLDLILEARSLSKMISLIRTLLWCLDSYFSWLSAYTLPTNSPNSFSKRLFASF